MGERQKLKVDPNKVPEDVRILLADYVDSRIKIESEEFFHGSRCLLTAISMLAQEITELKTENEKLRRAHEIFAEASLDD